MAIKKTPVQNVFEISTNGLTSYQVRVKDKLKKYYPRLSFSSFKDALEYRDELIELRKSGVLAQDSSSLQVKTFRQYVDLWLKECFVGRSEQHAAKSSQLMRDYVVPVIGDLMLTDIKSRHINQVIQYTIEKRSIAMSQHVFRCISKAFNDAVDHFELLHYSPVKRKHKPKHQTRTSSYLNPEDSIKVIKAAKGHYLEPAIWIGFYAGLRVGEIQALNWSDIDLEKRVIILRRNFNPKTNQIENRVKARREGYAIIAEPLAEFLETIPNKVGLVVKPEKELGVVQRKTLSRFLESVCEKAGVTRITMHGMRHSTSEIWIRFGATKEDLQRLYNHSSASTTARYVHSSDDRLRQISNLIKI